MPRKGKTTPKAAVGDTGDPDSLYHHMLRPSQWQREKNYSERMVKNLEYALRLFISWASGQRVMRHRNLATPVAWIEIAFTPMIITGPAQGCDRAIAARHRRDRA